MTVMEWVAMLFGLVSVWLTVRQNIWCWPTGLVMVLLYIFVFFGARLYSDMGLQVVYVFLQIYGWHYWLHGEKDRGEVPVTRIGPRGAIMWTAVGIAGTAGLGASMNAWTNAALPFWDACATVMSLIAQWLMARKVLESWLVWIAVDVLSIGIYLAKGLLPTTILYVAFLFLATKGFLEWRKSVRTAELQPA